MFNKRWKLIEGRIKRIARGTTIIENDVEWGQKAREEKRDFIEQIIRQISEIGNSVEYGKL